MLCQCSARSNKTGQILQTLTTLGIVHDDFALQRHELRLCLLAASSDALLDRGALENPAAGENNLAP